MQCSHGTTSFTMMYVTSIAVSKRKTDFEPVWWKKGRKGMQKHFCYQLILITKSQGSSASVTKPHSHQFITYLRQHAKTRHTHPCLPVPMSLTARTASCAKSFTFVKLFMVSCILVSI